MSGEILVDGEELWSEYLRLLREAGQHADADQAETDEHAKRYATVEKPWLLRSRVEALRADAGFRTAGMTYERLDQTLRERRYGEAAQLLPEALSAVLDILATENLGWKAFPALTPAAITVAALFPNETVDEMYRRLAALPNTPNVGAYSRVLGLRRDMQSVLSAVDGVADRSAVKVASGLDGRAFTNTVQWLAKAGALDDDGVTLRPATGAPATEPPEEQEARPSGYRLPAALPPLLDLNEHPRVAGPDMYDKQPGVTALSRVPEPTPQLMPTPQPLRPAGQARMLGTKHCTWLLTAKRPTAEIRPVWTAAVFDRHGTPRGTVTLPAPAKSWTAGPDRDWVCIADEDEHLRVYREAGELIIDVDLGEVARGRRSHLLGLLPFADFDVTDDRLLITSGPNVWLLHPDGSGWGLRIPPKVYPSGAWQEGATPPPVRRLAQQLGLREDLTTGEAVSHLAALGMTDRDVAVHWPADAPKPKYLKPAAKLHEHLGLITDDNIAAARLTSAGVTVSTRYGLNADISNDGTVARLWTTFGTLTTLSEQSGSRAGVVADAVVSVADGIVTVNPAGTRADIALNGAGPSPVHETAAADGDPLPLPEHVIRVSSSSIHIVNTITGTARTYPVPKRPSAVVRAGDHLRIHVGAKHAQVPLP